MKMMLIFDLDGTLAEIGGGIDRENIELLRKLEDAGHTIAICSGKPSFYLCGFIRQVGLKEPILIGENGGTIQFGIDLPPERYYEYPVDEGVKKALKALRELIESRCKGKTWYQPNAAVLTVFPRDEETFEIIQGIVDELQKADKQNYGIYRHSDSFDFVPDCINKGNALRWLSEITGVPLVNMVAIGDGVNDIPMFEVAGTSCLIGKGIDYEADMKCETIGEALTKLEKFYA